MDHRSLVKAVFTGTVACFVFMTVILMIFTPLPLIALGLGSGMTAALLCGAVFFVLTALLSGFGPAISGGLVFVVPALWLVHLATQTYEKEDGTRAFYPADRLFYWTLGMAALATIVFFAAQSGSPGGLPGVLSRSLAEDRELLEVMSSFTGAPIHENQLAVMGLTFVIITPTFWAATMTVCLILAQFFNQRYRLNLRPTPEYSRFTLPSSFEIIVALGILLSFILSGWPSALVSALLGLLLFAFFLLGLATIHVVSRRSQQRSLLLALVYFLIFLFSYAYFLVSILGILESRFGLRRRFGGTNTP